MSDAIFIANAKKDQNLFINTIEKYGWKKDPDKENKYYQFKDCDNVYNELNSQKYITFRKNVASVMILSSSKGKSGFDDINSNEIQHIPLDEFNIQQCDVNGETFIVFKGRKVILNK